ncbi:MAG: hypothetical protein WCH65_05390 [bacterium]
MTTKDTKFICKIIKMNKNDTQVKHMLEQAKKIAIFGHMSPDGDCI